MQSWWDKRVHYRGDYLDGSADSLEFRLQTSSTYPIRASTRPQRLNLTVYAGHGVATDAPYTSQGSSTSRSTLAWGTSLPSPILGASSQEALPEFRPASQCAHRDEISTAL